MKYDDIYPKVEPPDGCIDSLIIFSKELCHCLWCDAPTNYRDLGWCAPVCSSECDEALRSDLMRLTRTTYN